MVKFSILCPEVSQCGPIFPIYLTMTICCLLPLSGILDSVVIQWIGNMAIQFTASGCGWISFMKLLNPTSSYGIKCLIYGQCAKVLLFNVLTLDSSGHQFHFMFLGSVCLYETFLYTINIFLNFCHAFCNFSKLNSQNTSGFLHEESAPTSWSC